MTIGKKAAKVMTIAGKMEQALVPVEEQLYKIPGNWCWTTLKYTAEIIMGQSPVGAATTYDNSYMPLIGGAADMGSLYPKATRYTKIPTKISCKGDLILCIRATLGRPIFSDGEYCLGRGVAGIRPYHGKSEFFRLFFLNFERYLYENATGTTFAQVSGSILQNMPIPLPPLAEQQRIVDRIESIFAKLDEAKEKAQAVVDSFELRKSAILHKAFTGELTAQWRQEHDIGLESWKALNIGDIGDVITGSTPSTKRPEYYNGNVPFIKPTELNQGRNVSLSVETLTEEGKAVSRPVRAGTTCVCCIGATISKCGFLLVESVTNQQINSIVPCEFMDDVFVYYYCCSNEFKESLIKNSSATTLPIINKKKMLDLRAVVPLKEEQTVIAQLLDSLLDKQERAKEAAEAVLDKIDSMKKAVLARAFRGELGTNDPAEESAEELVKAVLKERDKI